MWLTWCAADEGSNSSGYYDLQAVLTHKGRSIESGHYVAWRRVRGDEWVQLDDDKVTPRTTADILKLSGGGDWHTSYLLLYGSRPLPPAPAGSADADAGAAGEPLGAMDETPDAPADADGAV